MKTRAVVARLRMCTVVAVLAAMLLDEASQLCTGDTMHREKGGSE